MTFTDAGLPARRLERSFPVRRAVDLVARDIISKPDPTIRNVSLRELKRSETRVAVEYWWAITLRTVRFLYVLESEFQLDSTVYTYIQLTIGIRNSDLHRTFRDIIIA